MKREAEAGLGVLSLRIDLPQGRIGPGKIGLLEAIDREGSISAAGRALGMSYKRAWDLVDALNRLLGTPAVQASPGGYRGGGAVLTDAGRNLVADYRAIERAAQRAAEPRLAALAKRTKGLLRCQVPAPEVTGADLLAPPGQRLAGGINRLHQHPEDRPVRVQPWRHQERDEPFLVHPAVGVRVDLDRPVPRGHRPSGRVNPVQPFRYLLLDQLRNRNLERQSQHRPPAEQCPGHGIDRDDAMVRTLQCKVNRRRIVERSDHCRQVTDRGVFGRGVIALGVIGRGVIALGVIAHGAIAHGAIAHGAIAHDVIGRGLGRSVTRPASQHHRPFGENPGKVAAGSKATGITVQAWSIAACDGVKVAAGREVHDMALAAALSRRSGAVGLGTLRALRSSFSQVSAGVA